MIQLQYQFRWAYLRMHLPNLGISEQSLALQKADQLQVRLQLLHR